MRNNVSRRTVCKLGGAAAFLAAAALAGCSPAGSSASADNTDASTPTAPGSSASAVTPCTTNDAMMGFAADSSALVLATQDNMCFSPASLYLCLGMLGVGATGQSAAEVLQVLRAQTADDLAATLASAVEDFSVQPLAESTSLQVAFSAWSDEACPVREGFSTRLQEVCGAEMKTVAFGTPEADQAMQQWVSDHTQGLLKPQFKTEDPGDGNGTALELLNTIYIKPRWENPFDSSENETLPFTLADGTEAPDVEYMNQTMTRSVLQGEGYTVAALPFEISYGSGSGEGHATSDDDVPVDCRMVFLLPDEGKQLSAVLASPEDFLAFFTAELDTRAKVNYKLPKIDADFDLDLIEILKSLGVNAPFENSHDFEEMVEPPSADCTERISTVRQGTHFTMDEEGAEAAAYTEIGMALTSAAPLEDPPELDFFCNRPFAYCLTAKVDDAERVLFAGVVNNPIE